MLKRILSVGLLVALLSINFSRILLYGYSELNRDYIAVTLCENLDKPEMMCNGKCFLAKKIKQAEEKEKKQQLEEQRNSIHEVVVVAGLELSYPFAFRLRTAWPMERSSRLPERSFEILHPPPATAS